MASKRSDKQSQSQPRSQPRSQAQFLSQPQPQPLPQPQAAPSFPSRFVPVERGARPSHTVRRDPEGALVTKTGRILLNRAATDLVINLSDLFGDTTKCGIYWAADTNAMEVAGRVVAPSVSGVTPIRYDTQRKTVTLWLTEVFKDYPVLKPTSKAWVSLTREPDEKHGDYFIIHLNLALPRTTVTRSTQSKSAKSKNTQSEQKTSDTPAKEGGAA